jgi:type I restriction enzyme R subunit
MIHVDKTEKRFESDIEAYFLSEEGGYTKGTAAYSPDLGLFDTVLTDFVKETQPKAWGRFSLQNQVNTERKFCLEFQNACVRDGLISVLRHGFKHLGIPFRVCYFKPESSLNETASELYAKNRVEVYRQWHYSSKDPHKSVDMVLAVNGIPVFAFELKNQMTNQSVENAEIQWRTDRDPREVCFQFNRRVLAFFCVDLYEARLVTRLDGEQTARFLPFDQGSNGPGVDGGKGNPENADGYVTHYIWDTVFRKDSMMDILQKFIHLQKKDGRETIIFPRYHQLDCVRKLIADTASEGPGHNYLIQHSAGSGKSNTIAWVAYRLASLHDADNAPVFSSVIVLTDRTVLDRQLQDTISGFDHTLGAVETIGDNKTSADLLEAVNRGVRIIVSTIQKFPYIYKNVEKVQGRNYAVIVDEAHSSQTGTAALKTKAALADTSRAKAEYAEYVDEFDPTGDSDDQMLRLIEEMSSHGRHPNLSYYAFTATPKPQTLRLFGREDSSGIHRPFHVYSMRQAIEEGFIMDVLLNYTTYETCYKIAKAVEENPDLPSSRAAKVIRKYQELHPYNISQKSEIIVETFRSTTMNKIGGKGKMMVVTPSRLAAVRYYHEIKRYILKHGYDDMDILVAFSGVVKDGDEEYTEPGMNTRPDGSHISELQTKEEFHKNFNCLIVANKYQTGFDEPLLHTMVVDAKLKGVKAVQTLSRLNRICDGKVDTYVLDFVNSEEDIQEAFQPFYQETVLEGDVNMNLIYETQRILRDFKIYDQKDVDTFFARLSGEEKRDDRTLGKMTGILKPVVDRYLALDQDSRYQFRRNIRSFVRWYGFISQIVRMFDADMQKEYEFCSWLAELVPGEKVEMFDLEGKLRLDYYKLVKTHEGDIGLKEEKGVYESSEKRSEAGKDEKSPLDIIIDRINARYSGNFTSGDRVLLSNLHDRMLADKKLMRKIRGAKDKQIFLSSIFPKIFDDAAAESYQESQETFSKLFEDSEKYEAIMTAIGEMLFAERKMED